jgi:hypothetical protein
MKISPKTILPALLLAAGSMMLGTTGQQTLASTSSKTGFIDLYEHDAYGGMKKSVGFGKDIPNFKDTQFDGSDHHMNDRLSSYRYSVPDGMELQLCIDSGYRNVVVALRGQGELSKMHNLNDKISSLRWVRISD